MGGPVGRGRLTVGTCLLLWGVLSFLVGVARDHSPGRMAVAVVLLLLGGLTIASAFRSTDSDG